MHMRAHTHTDTEMEEIQNIYLHSPWEWFHSVSVAAMPGIDLILTGGSAFSSSNTLNAFVLMALNPHTGSL